MRDPDQFDAFYAETRQRLLLQTYALTGDLPAARSAVRDAFVAAWHHWHKVARRGEPEAWARPHAWQHAQRRHTARLWHRDRSLAPELRATLDALGELTGQQRKALLLHELAGLSGVDLARELGIPDASADRQRRLAAAQFAIHRDIGPDEVGSTLRGLSARTEEVRFPRATIVRRTGTARRRTHTLVGLAIGVATMAAAGTFVGAGTGVSALLASTRGADAPEHVAAAERHLAAAALLAPDQLAGLAPGATFSTVATHNNTVGEGLNLPCQSTRFADTKGHDALVRTFSSTVQPPGQSTASAVQVVERSTDAKTAHSAYDATLAWFSDCPDQRVQLLASYSLTGAGDEAALVVLRDWAAPVTTYTVAVARTGSIVTSLSRSVGDSLGPELPPFVSAIGGAVSSLCKEDGGGTCATTPRKTLAAPAPGPDAHGMLQSVDLPPVRGVDQPWVATAPVPARTNPAATTCDRAAFGGIPWSATRTFLVPEARLPARFGLSETVGRFKDDASAKRFVSDIQKRMGSCEKRDLSATVQPLARSRTATSEITSWRFTAAISDQAEVDYYVSLVRRGAVVAQIGFVPVAKASFSTDAFEDLAERALARLENLPPA
jgi:DNA-directed RNA polymerase specialized sigma24 family protein